MSFTEEELRRAIARARCWAETLRLLGYRPAGGNPRTIKKYAAEWGIDTSHFDGAAVSTEALRKRGRIPLQEILVEHSTYSRSHLKERLVESGLKRPECEQCGQGERWRGKRMAMILDHVNGIWDDNRIENLRILCPNCAATLDTHCGRKNQGRIQSRLQPRNCARCNREFMPKARRQRYCSRYCGMRSGSTLGVPRPEERRVDRPPHEQLLREVNDLGYLAVARKYGVSDTAIRKWLRLYARETALAEGTDPKVVQIPTRTWPNRRRAV